jgi:hypothetical protein
LQTAKNIIRVIKERMMRWVGHAARIKEMKKSF